MKAAQVQVAQATTLKEVGSFTVRGTVRKVNEDRLFNKVFEEASAGPGQPLAFSGVYDGHGGSAVAEWLEANLLSIVTAKWDGARPEAAVADAYREADKQLLSVRQGFMGMGERGVGGAKCGATAANVILYRPAGGGAPRLLASNIGDARTLLIRGGEAIDLSEEHVPDKESERERIEANNPNPKNPMVRYVGGTWRVGGLLALSRAFGDAYLKGSLQFEGINAGGDNYSSGFGVISAPYTADVEITDADTHIVIASDGLFNEEARGGGGGLDNATVAELCGAAAGTSCRALAETLSLAAQKVGSTDDVTVVVLRLK
ncbi:MAG: phosphatase 2C-like domain-containing protein [Monoraphidium minutum]|nr:MAG: phosphatase 2C-like domain-containing protein [Monoraphidium minutum]